MHNGSHDLADFVVVGTAAVLLRHSWCGMHNHLSIHISKHATPNATPDASTHTATHTTTAAYSAPRPKLRHWRSSHMGWIQEGVLLPRPPPWLPNDQAHAHPNYATHAHPNYATRTTRPSGPIQLRRWLCQLAGRLVSRQKGMVLQGSWQGLPWPGLRPSHCDAPTL